jgi:hypothetical protein
LRPVNACLINGYACFRICPETETLLFHVQLYVRPESCYTVDVTSSCTAGRFLGKTLAVLYTECASLGVRQVQAEDRIQWIKRTGLGVAVIPLLEAARALGFVAAQALLLGQPLLSGLVSEATLREVTRWLEDPQQVERLLEGLEGGEVRR